MKYLVANMGCDDTTYTEIELNYEELQVLLKYARLNNENSRYGCQPTIAIYDKYHVNSDRYYSYFHKNEEGRYVDNYDLVSEKEGD